MACGTVVERLQSKTVGGVRMRGEMIGVLEKEIAERRLFLE